MQTPSYATLLVGAGLADPSREQSIGSISVAPSIAARMQRFERAPVQTVVRRVPFYQGRLKATQKPKSN